MRRYPNTKRSQLSKQLGATTMKKPTYKFWYNLNKKQWSYQEPKEPVDNCITAILEDVTLKHPSITNKQFLRAVENYSKAFEKEVKALGGDYSAELKKTVGRKVFAFYKAVSIRINPKPKALTLPSDAERIYFNPKAGDTYFHFRRNGKKFKVDHLSKVYALANGETYGVL